MECSCESLGCTDPTRAAAIWRMKGEVSTTRRLRAVVVRALRATRATLPRDDGIAYLSDADPSIRSGYDSIRRRLHHRRKRRDLCDDCAGFRLVHLLRAENARGERPSYAPRACASRGTSDQSSGGGFRLQDCRRAAVPGGTSGAVG